MLKGTSAGHAEFCGLVAPLMHLKSFTGKIWAPLEIGSTTEWGF